MPISENKRAPSVNIYRDDLAADVSMFVITPPRWIRAPTPPP